MAGATELEHGTFTLTGMVAFQFYGCGEVTTPDGRIEEVGPKEGRRGT